MSNDKNQPDEHITKMAIQAQFGTPDQSSLIEEHMKEYFTRWPNYKSKFTNLEWYHIFLDFLDKVPKPPEAVPAQQGEVPEEIMQWIDTEIAGQGINCEGFHGIGAKKVAVAMYHNMQENIQSQIIEGAAWWIKQAKERQVECADMKGQIKALQAQIEDYQKFLEWISDKGNLLGLNDLSRQIIREVLEKHKPPFK